VFPDAKVTFIKEKLAKLSSNSASVALIINEMLEKGYEKPEKVELMKAESKLDFKSTNWTTSEKYRENASKQLQNDFPFLTVESLRGTFATHKYHYTPTRLAIEKAIGRKAYENTLLQPNKNLTASEIAGITPGAKSLSLSLKKTMSRFVPLTDLCKIFNEELSEFKEVCKRDREETDREFACKLNEALAEEDGKVKRLFINIMPIWSSYCLFCTLLC
jgi:hypothetical protein